jgi:hypothetical protein
MQFYGITLLLLLLLLLLFSRLYDVYTSSCAHFAIMLSSSSNCFYLSNLLPVTPFLPSFL